MNRNPTAMSKRTKPGSSSKTPGTPKKGVSTPRTTAASRARTAKLKTPTRPPRATKPDTDTSVASALPPSASVNPPNALKETTTTTTSATKLSSSRGGASKKSKSPLRPKASAKEKASKTATGATPKRPIKKGPGTPGLTRRVAGITATRRQPAAAAAAAEAAAETKSKSEGAGAEAGAAEGHADATVTARKNALSAMGGVKIDVFIRIRPESGAEVKDGRGKVVVVPGETTGQLKLVTGDDRLDDEYKFDQVLGQGCGQQEVFTNVVEPIVDQVSTGMSCCLYAYGQTGAGKTYTMRGELGDDVAQHGVIQRSVTSLFKRLHENPDYTDVETYVSFLEVYNETLEDLLVKTTRAPVRPATASASASKQRLTIIDDPERGSICHGLTEVRVNDIDEVMELLREADQVARVSATKMNKNSNRAHRICTVVVKYNRFDVAVPATLTFVDLAGSEDINKSEAKGATAKEAGHINKSLLSLGRVITALSSNKKHIPYRDSKLTQLMSESLGGLCKTTFIACISPSSTSLTETTKTLRYAERAMQALNISQMPQWKQDQIMIDGLTRKVGQLSVQLERQAKNHERENLAVRRENAHLKACVEGILGSLGKLGTNVANTLTAGHNRAAVRADSVMETLLQSLQAMGDAQESARVEHHVAGEAIAATVAATATTLTSNITETAAAHELAYTAANEKVGTFAGQIGGCTEALTIGIETTANLARANHELTLAGCNESETFVKWSGQQFSSLTSQAATLKSDATVLHAGLDLHSSKVQESAVSIGVTHGASGRAREESITKLQGAFAAAEKDADVFVNEQLRRDTESAPGSKQYAFPQSFAQTDEYSTVLLDTSVAWQREAQIMEGDAAAGAGVDYPGNLGAADGTGILDDPSSEVYASEHKDIYADAARDSDDDEYEGEADELLQPERLASPEPTPSPDKSSAKSASRGSGGGARPARKRGGAGPGAVSLASSNPARNLPRIDRSTMFGNASSTKAASPRRPPRNSRP